MSRKFKYMSSIIVFIFECYKTLLASYKIFVSTLIYGDKNEKKRFFHMLGRIR
jgi:hypothetical protein